MVGHSVDEWLYMVVGHDEWLYMIVVYTVDEWVYMIVLVPSSHQDVFISLNPIHIISSTGYEPVKDESQLGSLIKVFHFEVRTSSFVVV